MHQKVPRKNASHGERRAFRKCELLESESHWRCTIHTVRCTHIRDSSKNLYTHATYLHIRVNTTQIKVENVSSILEGSPIPISSQ